MVSSGASGVLPPVYAYYEEVAANGMSDVVLVENTTKNSISIGYSNFKGIDAQSSPIRYRACFTTQVALEELQKKYVEIDNAVPRTHPDGLTVLMQKR